MLERICKLKWSQIGVRAARSGVVFSLTLMIVAWASIAIVHRLSMRAYRSQVVDKITLLAAAAASQVDVPTHDLLRNPSQHGSSDFERVALPLRRMLEATPGIKYIYTYAVVDGTVRFVVDSTPAGDNDGDGRDDQAKLGEVYEDPDEAMLVAARTEQITISPEPHRDEWGVFVSGFAPVRREDGTVACYLGVDVTAEEFESQLGRMERTAFLAGVPAGLVSVLAGVLIWRVSLARQRGLLALRVAEAEARATADRISAMNVELEKAAEAAHAGARAKSAFVSNISHEIRTPMTAILGYIDLMAEEGVSEADLVSHLATIRRAGEHLLSVINDILDFSKIEAGKMTIERVALSPDTVAGDSIRMLEGKAASKGLALMHERASGLPGLVLGDPTRLAQILVNLIGNAVKFTQQGRIIVRSSHDGRKWRVEVEDTGMGMTKEQVSRMFTAFSQADVSTSRKFGGTGLGLVISKRLAEAMGGTLTLRSTAGVGTTFVLEVPAESTTGVKAESAASAACSLSGLRVLLAEDSVDNQRLIRHHLTKAGAEVIVTGDGLQAYEYARASKVDVVLMDMQMPVMDGYEATRRLRDDGYAGPIVALTANTSDEDRTRSLAAGCDDLASKPLQVPVLLALLRRMADAPGRGIAVSGEGV